MLTRAFFGALLFCLAQGVLAQGNAPAVSVTITAPAGGAVLGGPASVTLSAAASINRANWAILRVEFYSGASLIGTAGAAPYSFQWTNVAPGTYTLTAKAIAANPGQAKQNPATHPNMPTLESVSAPVTIRVDAPPVVSLTAPANNALYAGPATIALAASATDSVGTITKVDFYQGATLIGTASAAPYSFTWTNVAPGVYSLSAVATNDAGQSTASSALSVKVDAPPSVALSSPANGAAFSAPANIPIAATVSDTEGTVRKVAFYQGATLIATRNAPPYSFSWTGVSAGSYSLTAVATNDAGQSTTSAPIAITVRQAAAQLYFIEVDHLNTPRLVADSTGTTVWRWDQQEPFGNNVADENPSGLGAFELPLRFPGQYADKETNLIYNYFRNYDPAGGRYIESDPIGLDGGLNTYAYVESNSLSYNDPSGLLLTALHMLSNDPEVYQNATLISAVGTGPAVVAAGTIGIPAATAYAPGAVVGAGIVISEAPAVIVQAATQPSAASIWARILSLALRRLAPNSAIPNPPTPTPPAIIRQVPQLRQPGPPGRWNLPAVGAGVGTYSCRPGDGS